MLIRITLFFLLFTAGMAVNAQDQNKEIKVVASVVDKTGLPIPGMSLYVSNTGVKGSYGFATDITGRVELRLKPGNNEITTNRTVDPNYRLFILIPDSGPIPGEIRIMVDPQRFCCSSAVGVVFPPVLNLPKPPYPPAARAVRASGEVVVDVEIDETGAVTKAAAVSGHPLLRAASAAAAKNAQFNAQSPGTRTFSLTYAFFLGDEKLEKEPRYTNPYRIEVMSDSVTIHTMTTH